MVIYQGLKSGYTSSEGSSVESNCVKSCSSDLRQTLARTLSLPRCGTPMMMLSTPSSLDLSIIIFIAGIKTSQPSIPNRFSELHFFARKASNLSHSEWKEMHRENWAGRVPVKSEISCQSQFTCTCTRMSCENQNQPT